MNSWRERVRNGLIRLIGSLRRPTWETTSRPVYRFLTYHRIQPCRQNDFRRQLDRLQTRYNLVSPSEFERDEGVEDGLNLLLTFDDGYREWDTFVREELDRRDIQAVFFICPDFVGLDDDEAADYCRRYLRLSPARPLTERGLHRLAKDHTLGNHLLRHEDLRDVTDPDRMQEVMKASQDAFERRFGRRPAWLAYPFGDYFRAPEAIRQAVSQFFDYAVTLIPGVNSIETPTHLLHREGFSPGLSPSVEANWLKGGYDPIHALTHLGKGT